MCAFAAVCAYVWRYLCPSLSGNSSLIAGFFMWRWLHLHSNLHMLFFSFFFFLLPIPSLPFPSSIRSLPLFAMHVISHLKSRDIDSDPAVVFPFCLRVFLTHELPQSIFVSPDQLPHTNLGNEPVLWNGLNHVYFLPMIILCNTQSNNVSRIRANVSCRLISIAAPLQWNLTDVKDTIAWIGPRLSINHVAPLTSSHNAAGCMLWIFNM